MSKVADFLRANQKAAKAQLVDDDVFSVLQTMPLIENRGRKNVFRGKQSYVYSDTLGLVRGRDGKIRISEMTLKLGDVCTLLGGWLKLNFRGPQESIGFTSITVNRDFNSERHRDENNEGPSILKALGQHKGGELLYFYQDPLKKKPKELDENTAVLLKPAEDFVCFNGKFTHEAREYSGQRYSIVFWTIAGWRSVSKEETALLEKIGFKWPSVHSLTSLTSYTEQCLSKMRTLGGIPVQQESKLHNGCTDPDLDPTKRCLEQGLGERQEPPCKKLKAEEDGDLNTTKALALSGFRNHILNATYIRHNDRCYNGCFTYWKDDDSYFMYYSRDQWRICPRFDSSTQMDMFTDVHDYSCAYEDCNGRWHELCGNVYLPTSVFADRVSAKDGAPASVVLRESPNHACELTEGRVEEAARQERIRAAAQRRRDMEALKKTQEEALKKTQEDLAATQEKVKRLEEERREEERRRRELEEKALRERRRKEEEERMATQQREEERMRIELERKAKEEEQDRVRKSTPTARPSTAPSMNSSSERKRRSDAAVEDWQERDGDGNIRCKPCGKICDGHHELSDAHLSKIEWWRYQQGVKKIGYEPPELMHLAYVPTNASNPDGNRQLRCLLCQKWVGDDTSHTGTHENPTGSKEHVKNLRNCLPDYDWWKDNVAKVRLQWHPVKQKPTRAAWLR
mmetsp:Transcript_18881/g.29789  ORF Transcript_18881/g.29789 Transcript_18881/m.29789 type:complete len:684 (-) Transcript_18881:55-2106(-)